LDIFPPDSGLVDVHKIHLNSLSSFWGELQIDLLLRLPGGELWAVEIKNSLSPRLEKGFHLAHADLKPFRSFAVYPGNDRYPINKNVDAISLLEICRLLAEMSRNTGE
jgi:uncharacterized protein